MKKSRSYALGVRVNESDTRPTDAEAGLFLPSVRVSFRFDFKHSLTTR